MGSCVVKLVYFAKLLFTLNGHYELSDTYSGSTFFDGFNFRTFDDPTHGTVDYSTDSNLAYYDSSSNSVIIKVDNQNLALTGRGRRSVRISSKISYNQGLFLFDTNHIPFGCGTWPAYWMFGPYWPNNGEIDILEGVHTMNYTLNVLHTKDQCDYNSYDIINNLSSHFSGHWEKGSDGTTLARNCYINAINQWNNQGCGIAAEQGTFGQKWSVNSGGLTVTLIHRNIGIKIWNFQRDNVPSVIADNTTKININPDDIDNIFGIPSAYFPFGFHCPSNTFNDLNIIINIALCGDWAGNSYVWDSACSSTGYATCDEYVRNVPSGFDNAYWDINYLKVFQFRTTINCDGSSNISCTDSAINCPSEGDCVINCGTLSGCNRATFNCPLRGDCIITCDDTLSCFNAMFYGPTDGVSDFYVYCNGDQACQHSIFHAEDSGYFNFTMGTTGGNTATSTHFYFPPKSGNKTRAYILAKDASFSAGFSGDQHFFALNGWKDIVIDFPGGDYSYHGGVMHCNYGCADTCPFATDSWECDPSNTICNNPILHPTDNPTLFPTTEPTMEPTTIPTSDPTMKPTGEPTNEPTAEPTIEPTLGPTSDPTIDPTNDPSTDPTWYPSTEPTIYPSQSPTVDPTIEPTRDPSQRPTFEPTTDPTLNPTNEPTNDPSTDPSQDPTSYPTAHPTKYPTKDPTLEPTKDPTSTGPTDNPSADPTVYPTVVPTSDPLNKPTQNPSTYPTSDPSSNPTLEPTVEPIFSVTPAQILLTTTTSDYSSTFP